MTDPGRRTHRLPSPHILGALLFLGAPGGLAAAGAAAPSPIGLGDDVAPHLPPLRDASRDQPAGDAPVSGSGSW